jgi:hypothetical protein
MRTGRCVLALVVLQGCGAAVEAPAIRDGAAGGAPGSDGPSGNIPVTDGGGLPADATIGPVGDAACAMQTIRTEKLPLDLYLMLDTSFSMLEETSAGPSKWEAVKGALAAFIAEPETRGVGLGLQYFPLVNKDIPEDCLSDRDCATAGPCKRARSCSPSSGLDLCETDNDCAAGQTCRLLGGCKRSVDYCIEVGMQCPGTTPDNGCEFIPGYCRARDRCDPALYAAPEVEIAPLPDVAAALVPSLTARQPDGLTPTGPALAGAIQHLRARLAAKPDRRAAVVLATDGFPVECTPMTIPDIAILAHTAAYSMPPIPTFVIGVFSALEGPTAMKNLDELADAGGTGKAFVISTGSDVTSEFLAALNQISQSSTTALACEYKIPPASMGTIDFTKVNVQVTPGEGAATTLPNVANKAACNPTRGGWYYDADPAGPVKPTKVVACEATCAALRMDAKAQIDIVLGCQTTRIVE